MRTRLSAHFFVLIQLGYILCLETDCNFPSEEHYVTETNRKFRIFERRRPTALDFFSRLIYHSFTVINPQNYPYACNRISAGNLD